ncbi:hypothetical protein [Endozoicomonas sp. ISHI1]|uniref:hypothetical protein n=2 Tax=unclassified Endozoicomonas TaxID=2644528 RepID=UPI0021489D9A|nr:hypothetical protein [Endozoicomonas sp. ISHI1]
MFTTIQALRMMEVLTYTLLDLTRPVRELFTTKQRFTPEARNISFSETRFDIAPSNVHLSFADL